MRVAVLNWRDTANPEGGGSEVYIEEICSRLVGRGHEVTLICQAYGGAPAEEVVRGIRVIRRGTKISVYGRGRALLRSGELGPLDVVVDTQNGIPFFASRASAAPVVILVHHVHREQWPVVYDPVRARAGWLIESRLAVRAFRGLPYIAVSETTREELVALGVDRESVTVVNNGVYPAPAPATDRDPRPRVLVLGRLVPHKRVEHVLEAAGRLRRDFPDLTVAVVGDGWWAERLHRAAREIAVDDMVDFTGHVSEAAKQEQLARAWVLALPSLKEGWGLVVMEAAAHGVPAVAYRSAGGVAESIRDGMTGLLADQSTEAFADCLRQLLETAELRAMLGKAARERALAYSWDDAADRFEAVLAAAAARGARRP